MPSKDQLESLLQDGDSDDSQFINVFQVLNLRALFLNTSTMDHHLHYGDLKTLIGYCG